MTDVTEWIYRRTVFEAGAVLPDGTRPAELMQEWGPWVIDCLRMLDAEGAYAHYFFAGALGDQPAIDMDLYDVIRGRWVELMNEQIKKNPQLKIDKPRVSWPKK